MGIQVLIRIRLRCFGYSGVHV